MVYSVCGSSGDRITEKRKEQRLWVLILQLTDRQVQEKAQLQKNVAKGAVLYLCRYRGNVSCHGTLSSGKRGSAVTKKISEACHDADISIRYENGEQQVILNGKNVTAFLRKEEVGNMASVSSANPEVRAHLLKLQRNLAAENNVVMDGRDIGTTILPNAEVKIFLTASAKTRASRRYLELTEKGEACDMDEILKDIVDRDERDMNRAVSPLKKAEDAVLVDSSEMGIDEVVESILSVYRKRVNG